jgi:hypothetical protein
MTHKEAVAMFKDEFPTLVRSTDIPAKREAFGIFLDSLHRSGQITDRQVISWHNPF